MHVGMQPTSPLRHVQLYLQLGWNVSPFLYLIPLRRQPTPTISIKQTRKIRKQGNVHEKHAQIYVLGSIQWKLSLSELSSFQCPDDGERRDRKPLMKSNSTIPPTSTIQPNHGVLVALYLILTLTCPRNKAATIFKLWHTYGCFMTHQCDTPLATAAALRIFPWTFQKVPRIALGSFFLTCC